VAAKQEVETIVKLLLDTGIFEVNTLDEQGLAPLSWVARERHEAIVELLLDTGKIDVVIQHRKLLFVLPRGRRYIAKVLQLHLDSKSGPGQLQHGFERGIY
jgi:ankyrin repeat protein